MEMSSRLKKVVDKSLDVVIDRLENGDHMFNPRTGEIVRIPLKARDALKAIDTSLDKRQLLQQKTTQAVEQHTIEDRLANLLAKFEQMGSGRLIEQTPSKLEIIDASESP
jgi:hypothetical protein